MKEILKTSTIVQYTRDRAILEVEMCKDLYAVYNDNPIIGEIREVIATAFENVVSHIILPARIPAATTEAVNEGQILQVFAKHANGAPTALNLGPKCRAIIDAWQSWDAADCSDLSRLMGSILEKAQGAPEGGGFTGFQSEYTRYKPDEFYKNNAKQAGRSRTKDDKQVSFSAPHSLAGRGAGQDARFMIRGIRPFGGGEGLLDSGITPFRLMPHSTVRKIDIAFGLPEGADISGTTSDSIIMNQLVAKFTSAISAMPNPPTPSTSKLLQLLPLVTMISHGHHTLVESALTLTLFGVCEYRIGFYTSLLSGAGGDPRSNTVGGNIMRILRRAENDARNRHIICSYDTALRKFTAVHYDTPDDIRSYRSFATTGEEFLKFFRHNVHDQVYKADLVPLLNGSYKGSRRVRI